MRRILRLWFSTPQIAEVSSNDGNTLLNPWSPHLGFSASSACDARSAPASVRLMTTYLVLLHLCSCGLLRTFSQHSHKSLTGLLFQVSDIFTIMLGSRSSSCSAPDHWVRRQRGKAVPSTASTHPAVFVIHHDAVGASTPQIRPCRLAYHQLCLHTLHGCCQLHKLCFHHFSNSHEKDQARHGCSKDGQQQPTKLRYQR